MFFSCIRRWMWLIGLAGISPQAMAQYNYAEALQKTLFFYEAQRSGKMPANNRISWRGDSHLDDGRSAGIDLTGGWYDAGDSPKWNATMAFAASTLAWSAVEYPNAYTKSGQMPYLLDNLKWVGDYFIKCLRFKSVDDLAGYRIFVEVGNADEEHKTWAANEVMQALYPKRPVFYADKDAPSTSVVAAMAASQAVSSVVFRAQGNGAYADALLLNARKLYAFATAYQGNNMVKNHEGKVAKPTEFYDDDHFQDQLCWAALWLYEATKNSHPTDAQAYLAQAEKLAAVFASRVADATYWYSGYELACYMKLADLYPQQITYKKALTAALERLVQMPQSPGGLTRLMNEWGTLRHVNNCAWIAFLYADHFPTDARKEQFLTWAKSQLDYALGSNPQNRSYLIGFQPPGKTVVNTPHHGTAHGPWAGWEHLNKDKPEFRFTARHVLYGGLVGGPNWNDDYKAEVGNAAQTEVALDFNAGITANLARMTATVGGKPLSAFPPREKPDLEYFVEAAVVSSQSNSLEIRARVHNRSAFPAQICRNLSFRYFFQVENASEVVSAEVVEGSGAVISKPIVWKGTTYVVTVSFPNTPVFPGGLDPAHGWQPFYRKEVTFRLKTSGVWNTSNDWSYKGVALQGKNPVVVSQISLWEGKRKLSGNEPPR